MENKIELIFVYNADSSFLAQVGDYFHKAVAPSTYKCNLCQITYGGLGMKDEWKEFVDTLSYKTTFLHRDEFTKEYPNLQKIKLPALFKKEGQNISEFISAEEINKQKTVENLKDLVRKSLNI